MILDLSAGLRSMWFEKDRRDVVWIDVRPVVKPSVVADAGELPFAAGSGFDLVVLDPPHMNVGYGPKLVKAYGHWTTAQIERIVRRSAEDAHRVTRPGTLMAFKWNDHDVKLNEALGLVMPWWEPLFGSRVMHRTKHAASTYWVMCRRKDRCTIEAGPKTGVLY